MFYESSSLDCLHTIGWALAFCSNQCQICLNVYFDTKKYPKVKLVVRKADAHHGRAHQHVAKPKWICSERPITICTLVKAWLCQGPHIWHKCDVTRRQTNEGSLTVNITEKRARQHAQNTTCRLLAAASLFWPAGYISTCFIHQS